VSVLAQCKLFRSHIPIQGIMKKAILLPLLFIHVLLAYRHTNYLPSLAPKSCCLSCPRPVSYTPLRLRNSSRLSPNQKARISSRHVSMRPMALSLRPCPLVRRWDGRRVPWAAQVDPPSRTTCPAASRLVVVPPTRRLKTKTTQTTMKNPRTAAVHRWVTNADAVPPPPIPHQQVRVLLPPTPVVRPRPTRPTLFPRLRYPSRLGRHPSIRTLVRRPRSPSARRRPRSSNTNRLRHPLRNTLQVATTRSSSTTSSRSTTTRWDTRHTS
jgi:hypothetical protein